MVSSLASFHQAAAAAARSRRASLYVATVGLSCIFGFRSDLSLTTLARFHSHTPTICVHCLVDLAALIIPAFPTSRLFSSRHCGRIWSSIVQIFLLALAISFVSVSSGTDIMNHYRHYRRWSLAWPNPFSGVAADCAPDFIEMIQVVRSPRFGAAQFRVRLVASRFL